MSLTFTLLVQTEYGPMLVNRYDSDQTNSLVKTGQALGHSEIEMLRQLLTLRPPGPIFVDVGANVGTHTLALCRQAKIVFSFEPQRMFYNMLCGTLALNAVENVFTYQAAVGDSEEPLLLPQVNYHEELSFGGVRFTPGQMEPGEERVPQCTLDSFAWPRCDLIKVDVEGMEKKVLAGAVETLRRCRPFLLVEHLMQDMTPESPFPAWLSSQGYTLHQAGMNYLGIPTEQAEFIKVRYADKEHSS